MRLWDKHRPKSLTEMVGQPCLSALRKFTADPYPVAMIFEGPPGTGKTAAATALAADMGCVDEWSGLDVVPSVDLTIERCRELFERTLRLIPMKGNGWHVLIIEELEFCSSGAVQRYLKVALDTAKMPRKCVVIATSNGTSGLDPALVQRFDHFTFRGDDEFAKASAVRLGMIWTRETGKASIPGDVIRWGRSGDSWSFREALKQMQQIINLST